VGVRTAARLPVDRASPDDMMQLAVDVGPAPMHVGAALVLATRPGFNVAEAQRVLGERICTVPRLRQRLRRAPLGCGRPFWADDPAFDLRYHLRQRPCPPPGDERALLAVAAAVTGEPLPRSRPLWSATFVTGLADGSTGLVIVMNHVLADGIGGLAVLARLVDEAAGGLPGHPPAAGFPVPAPPARILAADAWLGRAGRLAHPAGSVRAIRHGLAELGGAQERSACTSAALLGPLFRLLAATGLLHWFFGHQRLIHTFVTNLRGPAEPLTFAGAAVQTVTPIPNMTGNVTVTFAALSYAGTLRITVMSDPSRVPDVAVLTTALRRELGSAVA